MLDDVDGAVEALQRSLELAPHSTRAMNVLAEEHLRAGRTKQAATWIERSRAIDPKQLELERLHRAATEQP